MKLAVVAVGAPRTPGLAEAIAEYESRVARYFKFETIEVRAARIGRGADPEAVAAKESEALLARTPADLEIVAVDERGARWSTEQLANRLSELALHGRPGMAFLLGGPLGLDESLRRRADHVLSLSSFTLPHEMARLVLTEQLYRAGTIQRGEPYHKGG